MALRDALGHALLRLASSDQFVVIDADNAPATRVAEFASTYPERYVNVGCAEQNMVGVAAGIRSCGVPVIVVTFGIFLCGRAFEQVRNGLAGAGGGTVLVGTHSGVTVGHDGYSHFAIEDVALMRSIGQVDVLVASCEDHVESLLSVALRHDRPVYLRISRSGSSTSAQRRARIGGGDVHLVGSDVAIFSSGILLDRCLLAARNLRHAGIAATVADIYSVKPLPNDLILSVVANCGTLVTVEEHVAPGGMGEALAALTARMLPVPIEMVNVTPSLASSGPPEDVLDACGCSVAAIEEAAMKAVARKRRHGNATDQR